MHATVVTHENGMLIRETLCHGVVRPAVSISHPKLRKTLTRPTARLSNQDPILIIVTGEIYPSKEGITASGTKF